MRGFGRTAIGTPTAWCPLLGRVVRRQRMVERAVTHVRYWRQTGVARGGRRSPRPGTCSCGGESRSCGNVGGERQLRDHDGVLGFARLQDLGRDVLGALAFILDREGVRALENDVGMMR